MPQKHILIIGGTGILGKSIIQEALKTGAKITVIGLSIDTSIPQEVTQIVVDRKNEQEFDNLASNISQVDILIDVADFDKKDAEQTYLSFKQKAKHFFIISTTLVYDRTKPFDKPIPSSYPLAKKGTLGGYADKKLDIEQFWQSIKDVNWTILRPYHILSPQDSLLGCIPDHNRDPELIERIKRGEPLVLCDGGNVRFNFIDARDIAKIILKAAGNNKTFHKAYNVVNPQEIIAKKYYEIIGQELGKQVIIKNKSLNEVWKENKGWQLTTLPNLYDISDLKRDINFAPTISINQSLKEAIAEYQHVKKPISEIPVHQRMTLLPRPKPIKWLLDQ